MGGDIHVASFVANFVANFVASFVGVECQFSITPSSITAAFQD